MGILPLIGSAMLLLTRHHSLYKVATSAIGRSITSDLGSIAISETSHSCGTVPCSSIWWWKVTMSFIAVYGRAFRKSKPMTFKPGALLESSLIVRQTFFSVMGVICLACSLPLAIIAGKELTLCWSSLTPQISPHCCTLFAMCSCLGSC